MSIRSLRTSGIVNFANHRSALAGNTRYTEPAYELISTATVSSNGSNVVFSNIPANYRHLQIRFSSKASISTVFDTMIQLNGVTSSSYAWHELQSQGTNVFVGAFSNIDAMRVATSPAGSEANIFNGGVVDILDYTSTSKNKTLKSFAGNHSSNSRVHIYSGLWMSTAAVTSISMIGGFAVNSRFSLYGVK